MLRAPGTTHRKGRLPVADLGRMWFRLPKCGRIKEVSQRSLRAELTLGKDRSMTTPGEKRGWIF